MTARVPVLDDDDLTEEQRTMIGAIGDLNVFRVLANNANVLEGFGDYVMPLYAELSPRDRELIILSVARSTDSEYEWHQHVDIAQSSGVSLEEIRAIGRGDVHEFDGREQALSTYVRDVCTEAVTDEVHDALAEYYDDGEIVAIGHLIGCYQGLATFLRAVDVPLEDDEEFVGWSPDA